MAAILPVRIALYEPDIPQNTGTILRLAACLDIEAHIIEPAGFPTSDRAFRRAGMDYLDQVAIARHADWDAFETWRAGAVARLIVFTTRSRRSYLEHAFQRGDVLLFGRETSGVPEKVHAAADARLLIPMREGLRSLNVAMAAAWPSAKQFGKRKRSQAARASARRYGACILQRHEVIKKHEAGEGHSHAPRRYPSPASLAGARH